MREDLFEFVDDVLNLKIGDEITVNFKNKLNGEIEIKKIRRVE